MHKQPFDFYFMNEATNTSSSVLLETNAFIQGIECASGDVYELRVWTQAHLERVHAQDRESGEHLGGQYLSPPDLVIANHDIGLIERIVADLIKNNGLRDTWRVPDELTACWVEGDTIADDLDKFDDTWQIMPVPEEGCGCMRGLRAED